MSWKSMKEKMPSENGQYLVVIKIMDMYFYEVCYWANNLNDVDEYDFFGEEYNHSGFYKTDSEWGNLEIPFVEAWTEIEPYEG